jgi:sporulation protein YlmC with PRC-barrel domain
MEGGVHIKMNDLPGVTVLDTTGHVIGRVKAALADMETWLIDTLRVKLERRAAAELDMQWSFWRRRPSLDLPTGLIQAAGDAIILRVSLAELREAPPRQIEELAAVH